MAKQAKAPRRQGPPWLVGLGQRLAQARHERGLTLDGLGEGNLSKSFLSLLESGRSSPSVETLTTVSSRLGISMAWLALDPDQRRLDTALSLVSIARDAAWSRPAFALSLVDTAEQLVPNLPAWAKEDIEIVRVMASVPANLDEAEKRARRLLASTRTGRFAPQRAGALTLLGHVAHVRRDFEGAFELFREAIAHHGKSRSLRSQLGIRALLWCGTVSLRLGRMRAARKAYASAFRLATKHKMVWERGEAQIGLGIFAWRMGDLPEAARQMREARGAFESLGDLANLSRALTTLGGIYRDQGKLDQALAALKSSVSLNNRLGDVSGLSAAQKELSRVYLQMGNFRNARAAALAALQAAKQSKDEYHHALGLAALGRVAVATGDRRQGIRALREAVRHLETLKLEAELKDARRDLETARASSHREAARDVGRPVKLQRAGRR